MAESKELNKIKKLYGGEFMHLCRRLFPTILEYEGILTGILQENFATNSRTLAETITEEGLEDDFKDFIFSKINVEKEEPELIDKKTPYELLEEAGYDLYECTSEEEIQSFRKYYMPEEKLCTFDGGRLDKCIVFWAVKKGAEEIKRENFKTPKREDEYGTSVMSIQFSKGKNSTVSIKNRYNHTVNNPDATYGNDLDRIIPGLTQSFTGLLAQRGYKLNNSNIEQFEIPGYTVASDGKYYKYNMEINGIYYCPGNIIIENGNVIQLESEKQVLMDYFVLDKEHKTLGLFNDENNRGFNIEDSFLDCFENIETIKIKKDKKEKGTRIIEIKIKDLDNPIVIKIDKDNNITSYKNDFVKEIGNNFLIYNKKLNHLEMPQVTYVLYDFLSGNKELKHLTMPNLRRAGSGFLYANNVLEKIELPMLKQVFDNFLINNIGLEQIDFPQLIEVGNGFLNRNKILKKLTVPKLTKTGFGFLDNNLNLEELELNELVEVGDCFLSVNKNLRRFIAPNLKWVGSEFLKHNNKIVELDFPKLKYAGNGFLFYNRILQNLNCPNLERLGYNALASHPNNRFLLQLQKTINRNNGIMLSDIVKLDKDNQITTSEISFAKKIIQKVRNVFEKKEDSQRYI